MQRMIFYFSFIFVMTRAFDLLFSSFESIIICYTEDQRNDLLSFLSQ